MEPSDLAIIVVAFNSAAYIEACIDTVFARLGAISADVLVVDVGPADGTQLIVSRFPGARYMRCSNGGFARANNCGLLTCDARYVLFLNPDTEILSGDFADLIGRMDARPDVGLVGVRQVDGEGRLDRTIRRFPTVLRALGDALAGELVPGRPSWLGERELDHAAYERDVPCDWTSGSFMLVRREAIESAGFMDERFFMYSEETDFCRRIRSAGWGVRHFPWMTILHYGAPAGVSARIESMSAYSRLVYARKHFSPAHQRLYVLMLLVRHGLRSVFVRGGGEARSRRTANRAAVRTLLGLSPPPHAPWSSFSVHPQELPASR